MRLRRYCWVFAFLIYSSFSYADRFPCNAEVVKSKSGYTNTTNHQVYANVSGQVYCGYKRSSGIVHLCK